MTNQIDRHIDIYRDNMSAHWVSGTREVSDLYVFKQYKALLDENARLQKELNELTGIEDVANDLVDIMAQTYAAPMPDPAAFDEDEQAMYLQGTGGL